MIERVRLMRYKGFYDFTLTLGPTSVLVGPNNAGKTTLVHALRLTASLLRFARRRRPAEAFNEIMPDGATRWVQGNQIASVGARELSWFKDENLRHELREEQTSIDVYFKGGAHLRAVWPVGDQPAFFYIEHKPGMIARTPASVAACTPDVGVVPTLSPIEHRESVLSANHVRESVGTRLTSRHFRNQLYHLRDRSREQYSEFIKFALRHTPELSEINLRDSFGPGLHELDVYFVEATSHAEKEVYWAGDGFQVWMQVLLHTWINLKSDTLVLDEPDVFLHPDLQRRLVSLLEDLDCQVVIATHAPEILTEVARDAVIWVDRARRRSRRARESADLARLNTALGSGFNLGMARALRSRSVLFVEGEDMKILRNLARAVGANAVHAERGLSVISLGGFSNWHQVEPFAWLCRDLLGDAVQLFVVLDRDHRDDREVYDLEAALAERNVHAHVWSRKELESYLLIPSAISRSMGVDDESIEAALDTAIEARKLDVQAAFIGRRQRDAARGVDPQTVAGQALRDFEAAWVEPTRRLGLVHPKEIIADVGRHAAVLGGRPASPRQISTVVRADEVDSEMADLLMRVEASLVGTPSA